MEVVINLLNSILSSNPNTQTLDLEFSQLTTIYPIVSLLGQFKLLKQLSLHGNRLIDLPEDLSMLNSLEELDITNNLIQKVDSVLPGLKTLKNLRKLSINIKGKEEELHLLSELFFLEFLNNEKISRNNSNSSFNAQNQNAQNFQKPFEKQSPEQEFQGTPSSVAKSSIKQEDLEALSMLYDCIREVQKQANPDKDNFLVEQFDEHVRNILFDLNKKLDDQSASVHQSKSLIIKAKYALYEICFSKFMDFLGGIDQRMAAILENLHDAHAIIFKDMSTLTQNQSFHEFDEQKPKSGYEPNEIQQIIEAAEHFESENQHLLEEKQELLIQLSNLEQENQKFLELILKYSKGDKNILANYDINKYKDIKIPEKENSQKAPPTLNSNNAQFTNTKQTETSERPFFTSIKAGVSKSAGINSNIGHTNIRVLTLKQLKDMIEEINDSKQKYDKKCYEMKMPRETMEQHMYSFLNQKYGLKNLIIEWAMAIINGIKKYCFEDNDVTVFGKVLRNECDEEFRLVQNQVKNTIVELLRMHLRGKFPFKHNLELKELIDGKINGFIMVDECQDIIKYMYNKEDAEVILEKLRVFYVSNKEPQQGKKMGREGLMGSNEKEKFKISFAVFQKTILDFQLKSHENFLRPFVYLFKNVDKDNNGIIDEPEFKELLNIMKLEVDENKMLYSVDPFNHQQINFSQLVTLLSSEMIIKDNKNLSLLQALSI